MRTSAARQALRAGKPVIGTWLSLGNWQAARWLARAGFDWLTVDLEHSPIDWSDLAVLLGAIADAGCTALARVPANRHELIKRALDAGAHGVVVPMVNSVEEARAAVAAAKYPPAGNRSVGGLLGSLNWDATPKEYLAKANEELLVILQCEHAQAVAQADQIFAVPGIDGIFVGPHDLAHRLRAQDGPPPSADTILRTQQPILEACRRNHLPAGIHCFSAEEAKRRADEGWQLLAINSDLRFLLDGAAAALKPFRVAAAAAGSAAY
ncbi:MAG TPA: aldolase/citrate lyase family protein [Gemmatales bacterium]|nr:aldolase/citrate lyase family protein [Gemmatales bacterium]